MRGISAENQQKSIYSKLKLDHECPFSSDGSLQMMLFMELLSTSITLNALFRIVKNVTLDSRKHNQTQTESHESDFLLIWFFGKQFYFELNYKQNVEIREYDEICETSDFRHRI